MQKLSSSPAPEQPDWPRRARRDPKERLTTTDSTRPNLWRATVIAVSDSAAGPFTLTRSDAPVTPRDFTTLDGTQYVDRAGAPWMVYAREWIQKVDGTMEAIPLTRDLTAAGEPIHLFKASDAPWLNAQMTPSTRENHYVTDGPELLGGYRPRAAGAAVSGGSERTAADAAAGAGAAGE